MRKIDKTIILSTSYKAWLDTFNTKKHILYRADYPYYNDVAMNLFYCQNGLCAYTEVQLCPKEYYKPENWVDSEVIKVDEKTKQEVKLVTRIFNKSVANVKLKKVFNGELDHFDSTLKKEKGWEWNNFFMIDADTNNRKGTEAIDYRLKPDSPDYDPFKVFDYSISTHRFIVRKDYCADEKDREHLQNIVDDVLGINFPNLVDKRWQAFRPILKMLEFGIFTESDCREFPTAFEFCQRISKIS